MRIPGSSPRPQISPDVKPNGEPIRESPKETRTQPHLDVVHNDSESRRLKSDLRFFGDLQQHQLKIKLDVLGKDSSGPQVKQLQDQLNEWRASLGKPPIKSDSIFGKETETALKDFQQELGLKQDGLAGPEVKSTLEAAMKLTKDPNYQNASVQSKKAATIYLSIHPKDPARIANVKDTLKEMVTLEQDPKFQQLPTTTKQDVTYTMFQYFSRPAGRQSLTDLAMDEKFQSLTADQQDKTISVLISNSKKALADQYPGLMNQILNSKALDGPKDEGLTDTVLNVANQVGSDAGKLYLLNQMLNDPKFVQASREDQLSMLKGFAGKSGVNPP